MTVSALSAARTLCEMRNWHLSNLALQKILYIAHMAHLGRCGAPLFAERIEAWDYGPVVPVVYQRVRGFGSDPIKNVFHWIADVPKGTKEYEILEETEKATRNLSPGQLVSITHWPDGAWAKAYRPGARGIAIPDEDIMDEYRKRRAAA